MTSALDLPFPPPPPFPGHAGHGIRENGPICVGIGGGSCSGPGLARPPSPYDYDDT